MTYQERLSRNILICRLQYFFTSLLFILPIWYAFETQFASPSTLAAMYALTYLVSVVLELPTGALADLIGRKNVVTLGFFIQGASNLYISQTRDASWLWIGYSIYQVGCAFVSGANIALLYDTLKELKKESVFNLIQSKNEIAYRIGITLASLSGGYIFLSHNRLPYILFGAAMIVAGIVTLFAVEPKIDTEKFTFQNYIHQTHIGFAQLWKTPYIRDFSLYYISVGGITWYYLFFLYNVFMTDAGFSPTGRGWLGGINSILVAVVAYTVTRYKILNRQTTYLFFPITMLLGFFLASFSSPLVAAASIFLIYLTGITRYVFLDQYANGEFDSKYRATALSALSMAINAIYLILSFLLNPILTNYGSRGVMVSLGVLTTITTVPLVIILLKKHSNKYPPF